jgi:hypothetical protein
LNHSVTKLFIKVLLRETQNGPVKIEKLKESLQITNESFTNMLNTLVNKNELMLDNGFVELNREQRLSLAVKAIEIGADAKSISESLGWLEFEELAAYVFEVNGFNTYRRFRFNAEGRRWELDVLASQYPYIVCAECKHWIKGIGNTTARNIIETHIEKCEVFSRHIDELVRRINIQRWRNAVILPITLTLSRTDMKIYRRVPSVNILMLPSFLEGFQGQLERIVYFKVELPEYKPRPHQTRLG